MLCRFAKFLPKGKTWERSRQRHAMTDFHRKVNKFWQRFACLRQKFLRQQIEMFKLYFGLNKFVKLRKLIILLEKFVQFQAEILTALDLCLVSSAIITVTAASLNYGDCTHIYSLSTLGLKLVKIIRFLNAAHKAGLKVYQTLSLGTLKVSVG